MLVGPLGLAAASHCACPPIPPIFALHSPRPPLARPGSSPALSQSPGPPRPPHPLSAASHAATSPPPASVDLSQSNPPVGDPGSVASCASWATGYYLRGWYARRDGYYPAGGPGGTGSFAPMYLYSQIT